jgi:ribonuclease H2 subunit C
LRIPQRYQGVLLASTDEKLPAETTAAASEDADEDQDEEQPKDVGIMEQSGQFNELMLWGHEVLPDDKNDPYICAIEEWLSLAEVVGLFRLSRRIEVLTHLDSCTVETGGGE